MKKIYIAFLIIFTVFSFTACKKREAVIQSRPEYIIGEWELEKIIVFSTEQNITDCHKQSRMIFTSNHEAHARYYTIYQSTGDCVLHLQYDGEWDYRNNKFIFIVQTGTSGTSITEEKELHFLDTDHFYIEEEYNGIRGKFYFVKIDN